MDYQIRRITENRIKFCILFLVLTISLTEAVESITGRRESCSNEGEEVKLDSIRNSRCFKCICQNGFVECEQESCPSVEDCYMLEKRPAGGCCEKCKECVFDGKIYASGSEWTDPEDPCISYKCVAGVVTETTIQCYTPCDKPLEPRPGQCCSTCLGCYLNGQNVLEGHEVTLTEDPCLKCHCSNKRLTCMKKACPVLQCPISKQIKVPGDCCPRCTERREIMQVPGKCILGKGFHSDGKRFSPDHCSTCNCANGTSICRRDTCPVLECSPEYQKTSPSDCCPRCPPVMEVRSTCTYKDETYQNNETWNPDPKSKCQSCRCNEGNILCVQTKCPKVKCRPNEVLITPDGQCCSKCVEGHGICTVFGDPHYKTFDGKFFSFQGSCKYQLTSDCRDHTFSIRVTNDGRMMKSSAWTKTVTMKIMGVKVNLGQKMRVKVNGTRVTLPFNAGTTLSIERHPEGIRLISELGIQLEWDGSNFLQVQVPTTYKNKLCGLCGNYNGIGRDDLMARDGTNHSEQEVWKFANSWKVGGPKSCSRENENLAKTPHCKHRKSWTACKPLRESQDFGDCGSILNPINYFESCRMDMCECPSGMCYCDSFAAYAHECQRLGVKLPDWRQSTNCPLGLSTHPYHLHQLGRRPTTKRTPPRRSRKRPKRLKYDNLNIPRNTNFVRRVGNRTPPPLH